MKTVVSERGQITLPKAVRVSLGLKPGTVLEISVVNGQLVGTKKDATDPLAPVARPRGVAAWVRQRR